MQIYANQKGWNFKSKKFKKLWLENGKKQIFAFTIQMTQ